MKVCPVDGCAKPLRARGLCSTHYNHRFQPNRHTPRKAACAACGTEVERWGGGGKGGPRRPVCSPMCRRFLQWGTWPTEPVDRPKQEARRAAVTAMRAKARAARLPAPEPFTPEARECAWCGGEFLASCATARFCSRAHKGKAKAARRRGREHGAAGTYTWSEVMGIYLRLGGCAYCWEPSDDIEPDHVVPLSRGGSNSITNIVPACKACNSDKRDLSLTEWADDRVRRGLTPRALHSGVRHLTHAILTPPLARGVGGGSRVAA